MVRTRKQGKRRPRAFLLALALTAALLFSLTVLYSETGHLCTGAHCHVCEGILRLNALLTQVAVAFAAIAALTGTRFPRPAAAHAACPRIPARTPVALRTRMND